MIKKMKPCDIGPVMQIWLSGNIEAHGFVPQTYWQANAPKVQKQLLQAEVYVYETEGTIQGFVGLQGDYLAGIFVEKQFRSDRIGKQLLDHVKGSHPALSLNVYQKISAQWHSTNGRAFLSSQKVRMQRLAKRNIRCTGTADIAQHFDRKLSDCQKGLPLSQCADWGRGAFMSSSSG